ncbi:MAG: sigma-70 family RNA polymerase sigma factor [Armatimonadota bacterium]|nr:sigma-70 family RNA polymerase sigma factor [Armatimonadota bacterium]
MSGGRVVEYVDVDLVRRTKTGDVEAFEQLFNRYQKRVYNIVYGMIGNENDAAELAQDVFVRVFDSIATLRAEEAFFTWVRTVAINVCRDHVRRRVPFRVESLDEKMSYDGEDIIREIADPAVGPERLSEQKETERAVHRAIDSLSGEHRTVVVLHHLEGMDVQDIAKALGCPTGTVKSRLARAREELRRKLAGYVES